MPQAASSDEHHLKFSANMSQWNFSGTYVFKSLSIPGEILYYNEPKPTKIFKHDVYEVFRAALCYFISII